MLIENFFYLNDQPDDDVKFLAVSNVRTKILLCLHDGPKKLGYLRESTGIASSTIIHGLGQLEKKNLLYRRGDNSQLTAKGKVVLLNMIKLMEKIELLNNQLNFWKNHNLKGIPNYLQKDLDALKDSYLVEVTLDNLEEPFTKYLDLLSGAKTMNAVLPVCFSRHTGSIQTILRKGGLVRLVIAKDVLNNFVEQFDLSELKKFIKVGNLEIYVVSEKLEVTCIISDIFVSLGLFFENGVYDASRLLMSHNEESLDWGNDLFHYYQQNAKKATKDTFNKLDAF